MTRSRRGLSRRMFLGSMGAAGLGASLIPLLESEAAPGDTPKRLILLCSSNGTVHEQWKPGFDGTTLTLAPTLAPLEAHKSSLVLLDGLGWQYGDGPGVDHGRQPILWNGTTMLEGNVGDLDTPSGLGGGISVDQFIAEQIGKETAFKSLEFGVQNLDGIMPLQYTQMIYGGPDQPIPSEDDPYAMFDRLFAEFGQSEAELANIRARRKSVLDVVMGNLGSVQAKVSASDRIKIESHLDAVRSIEQRLDLTAACEAPTIDGQIDIAAHDNFPVVSRLQIEMMVMAMRCDLTRISSLLWASSGSQTVYTWLGHDIKHHSIAHETDEAARNQIVEINTWHAGEVAYLMDLLQAVPEGDGTMLDNTLIVYGNEVADGWTHKQTPIPFLLAGGAGGLLQGGRYLDYGDTKHNQLLVSICNLMGLDEVTSFGGLDDGGGSLDGLV